MHIGAFIIPNALTPFPLLIEFGNIGESQTKTFMFAVTFHAAKYDAPLHDNYSRGSSNWQIEHHLALFHLE